MANSAGFFRIPILHMAEQCHFFRIKYTKSVACAEASGRDDSDTVSLRVREELITYNHGVVDGKNDNDH